MLHQYLIGRTNRKAIGSNGFVWAISAGFASKAAKKRSRQLNSAATAVNEKSLSKLLDFVKTLASATTTYPPAMAEPITIMVRNPDSGKPLTTSALLRTTGGDCSQSVARSLSGLFAATGAPSDFYWDNGMWILTGKKPEETDVQAARAKAAAAGIPSSEPMTLSELEAVQAKMEAKRKATTFSKFNAGEHFLSQPSLAAQPVAASSAQLSSSQSDAAPQHAVGNEGGAADNSLSQQLPASMLDMAHNSNSEAEPKSSLQLPHRQDAAQGSRDYDAVASPLQASYEMQDDSDDNIAAADDEEDVTDAQLMELKAELQKLDPLLAALAAVPWIDPDAEDGQRVPYIKSIVLDQVEGLGWDVRGGVLKIWAGERDLEPILRYKDTGSGIALEIIMEYALRFQQDFGIKTV